MTTLPPQFRLRRSTLSVLSVLSLAPSLAWSDEDLIHDFVKNPVRQDEVLGIAAVQELKYDSNVFRINKGTPTPGSNPDEKRDDWISTTNIRLGFDKTFGRQRVRLLAAPSLVRYSRFDQFDYVGQVLFAGWSGHLGTNGAYGLSYQRNKVATDPADQTVPTGNRVTTDTVGADLAIPVGPQWQAVTTWRAEDVRNSSPTEEGGNRHGWTADGGVRYVPTTGNNVDLRYRHSHFDYPKVIPSALQDNTYKQNEVELSWNYQPSEPSRFEGRTSYVQRRHEHFVERDFSGWVGSLKYVWRPTVLTSASIRIFKDIGEVTDGSASYAKSYGMRLDPLWEATTAIALGPFLEWRHRTYNGFSVVPRADERTTKAGIAARYTPTRDWQFGLSVSDEHRRSSDSAREYTDVISAVTAEWKM